MATPFAFLPSLGWRNPSRRTQAGSATRRVITRHMARSLSLVYASFGLVTLYVTLDWQRYRPSVPFLAWLHVAFGCGMVAIDWDAGLPWWWIVGEGPPLVGMGFLMQFLYRRKSQRSRRSVANAPSAHIQRFTVQPFRTLSPPTRYALQGEFAPKGTIMAAPYRWIFRPLATAAILAVAGLTSIRSIKSAQPIPIPAVPSKREASRRDRSRRTHSHRSRFPPRSRFRTRNSHRFC